MMYNSQIQRLHSFHRPPAQAVEACAFFGELCKLTPLPTLRPLKGRSHDVMSAHGTKRTKRAGLDDVRCSGYTGLSANGSPHPSLTHLGRRLPILL